MKSTKEFWKLVKAHNMGLMGRSANAERLIGATNRGNQKQSQSANHLHIQERAALLDVLEAIGLGSSSVAFQIQRELQTKVALFNNQGPGEMFPSQTEQQTMQESIKAIGIALDALDHFQELPDVIINADSRDEAISALVEQFNMTATQAECLVSLEGDATRDPESASDFAKEMREIHEHVLWDLKLNKTEREKNSEEAHRITLEAISRIEQYLALHTDADAASVLASFHYQTACDFNDRDSSKTALEHYRQSCDAHRLCYEISGLPKDLYALSQGYFFLGQQYDERLGDQRSALGYYLLAHKILKYLELSNSYADGVSDALRHMEDCIEAAGGYIKEDSDAW